MGDDELIDYVQIAHDDWGQLAQATGGILKQDKCSIYFLCYKFVKGRAKLKTLKDLPPARGQVTLKNGEIAPSHVTIPQPVGPSVPIQTLDVTDPSKMLGLHYTPVGDSTVHRKDETEGNRLEG